MPKRITGMILAMIIIVIAILLPSPEGLESAGKMAIALMLAGVTLWICDSFPVSITGFLIMALMPFLGVQDANSVFKGFISSAIFFVIAAYAITILIMKTQLALRLISALVSWSRNNSKKFLLAFMLATTMVSTIMQNMATVTMFLGIAFMIINPLKLEPGKSNFARGLMMGVPIATMAGGFGTPAGSAINMMAINMLENNLNISVSFLDWTLVGLPISIAMCLITWFFIVTLCPPEQLDPVTLSNFQKEVNEMGGLTTNEKKTLLLIGILLVLWLSSTWAPALNATLVAMLGLVAMFLPGVNLLTWDELNKGVAWNIILFIGSVQAISGGVVATGAAAWLANRVLSNAASMGSISAALLFATFIVVMHAVFPIGPAAIGMLVPPLAALAMETGLLSPAATTIMVAAGFGACFILPINPVFAVTYNYNYYRMTDVIRCGFVPTICFILLLALWVPFMIGVLGL